MSKFVSLKDLSFFDNGSVDLPSSSTCLVTSTIDVSSVWLIDTLCGRIVSSGGPVILVTFSDRAGVHSKGLKRNGIDLAHVSKSMFSLMDFSRYLFRPAANSFEHESLETLYKHVKASASINNQPPIVILEGPDLLLGSGFFNWKDVSNFVFDIQQVYIHIYI
jgi:hypothetical protein